MTLSALSGHVLGLDALLAGIPRWKYSNQRLKELKIYTITDQEMKRLQRYSHALTIVLSTQPGMSKASLKNIKKSFKVIYKWFNTDFADYVLKDNKGRRIC